MSADSLAFYSGWASIVSLVVAAISLIYVRSIKTNIVRFRRQQRLRQVMDEVRAIPDDAIPLSPASKSKLASLKRNIPVSIFACLSEQGRAAQEVHKQIDTANLVALKDAVHDWSSHSETL